MAHPAILPTRPACELCTTAALAVARDHEGRPVCEDHAHAIENGDWDPGEEHETEPLVTVTEEDQYLFVYGTLKNGSGHPAEIENVAKDDTGRYPTLYPKQGATVSGEIHRVTPEKLKQLDRYENAPDLYRRGRGPLGVWVYVGDPPKLGAEQAKGWHGGGFDQENVQELLSFARLTTNTRRPAEVPTAGRDE